jgi:O-antigen/teichoic acid export membrane protein
MSTQQEITANDSVTGPVGRRATIASFIRQIVRRHPTLIAVGNVLSASMVARALTVAKGLVVAKLVAPEIYAVSGVISIILAYAQYADLGTSNAALRNMTEAIGRSDDKEATRSAAWLGGLKLASIVVVALGALAFSRWPGLDASLRLGLTVLPAIALPTAMQTVILLQWQAHSRIKDFSRATRIAAALDFVFSVSLTWVWGLPGLLAAAALAPALVLAWSALRGPVVWPSLPPVAVLRRYTAVGAPFIALALIDHNLIYVDQLIVLRYFTLHDLGVYNIALIATEAVRIVGIATGVVIGPRLIRELASVGGEVRAIRDRTLRPVKLHACFVPFLVTGLWFAGGYFITGFYPRYVDSVRPMQILLLAFYFLVINGGVTTFLFAINKHGRNLLIIIPALLFNIVIDILLIEAGWGLLAIAVGSLITYILYLVVHLAYVVSHFELSGREWTMFYGSLLLPSVNLICALVVVERWVDYTSSLMSAVIACLLATVLLLPSAVFGGLILRGAKVIS